MRLTNTEKSNLLRFGCTFVAKEKVVAIKWEKERQNQALSATVVARFIHTNHATGPLLTLAFEISPTKALARYCFFPFDLGTRVHREYLSGIFNNGVIVLCFLSDSDRVDRNYEIGSSQCNKIEALYEMATNVLGAFPADAIDFNLSVAEFERTVRLVDHFGYSLSSIELRSMIDEVSVKAESATAERRIQAQNLAGDFLDIFQSRYGGWVGEQLEKLPQYLHLGNFILDLQAEFEGDRTRLTKFFADSLTVNAPQDGLNNLPTLLLLLESIARLVDPLQPAIAEEKGQFTAEQNIAIQEVLTRALSGQGVSVASFQSLLSMFGFQLGGKPGRNPSNYSKEYELKAAGHKWREVAEYTLQNDPQLKEEFSSTSFRELSYQHKHVLKNRVREGVRSYAKRTGRVFPPARDSRLSLPSAEEQEKP